MGRKFMLYGKEPCKMEQTQSSIAPVWIQEKYSRHILLAPQRRRGKPTTHIEGDSLLVTWVVMIHDLVTGDDPCSYDYPKPKQNGTTIPGEFTVICAHSKRW
jgi:hypothetical protein